MRWKPPAWGAWPVSSLVAEIQTRWTSLRGRDAPTAEALEVSSLTVDTGHGPAAVAISPLGHVQLLLPVAPGERRPVIDVPPALEIGATSLTEGDSRRAYIVVTCVESVHDRGFADLVEAVLTRIRAGAPAKDALATSIRDLGALFSRVSAAAIDDRVIRGLVAELIVLRRLAARHAGAPALWFGPIPERHDFRGGPHAIEVKSTSRKTGRVTISSADQLDPPAGGTLQLWRVALERTQRGAAHVAGLVSDIEALTGSSRELRDGLAALGCSDPHVTEWNRLSFNCEAIDAWAVEPGFPRIVPSMFPGGVLPAGIQSLTYELDPAVAAAFQVHEPAMEAAETLLLAALA
jgi:hypothetical protein